jgi:NAD-dependent SIR2 family protein deacetylase
MKKLYRFYCIDCDNAWHEILEENESTSNCDYCNKLFKPEDLKND